MRTKTPPRPNPWLVLALLPLAGRALEAAPSSTAASIVQQGLLHTSETARAGGANHPSVVGGMKVFDYIQRQASSGRAPTVDDVRMINRALVRGEAPRTGSLSSFRAPLVGDYGPEMGGLNIKYYANRGASSGQRQLLARFLSDVAGRSLSRRQAVMAAADVHHFIVRNHLFKDGNGRTARMMADWILMKNGLTPAHHGAVTPKIPYNQDFAQSPLKTRAQTRRYYMEATRQGLSAEAAAAGEASATRIGGRTPRSPRTARAARAAQAAENTGVSLLGLRHAGSTTRIAKMVGITAGFHFATQVLTYVMNTNDPTPLGALAAAFNIDSFSDMALGTGAYFLAEMIAANALAAIPVVGPLGRGLTQPLVQMAIRSAAGFAGANAVHAGMNGQSLDPVGLFGSSIAAGVGMAVGAAMGTAFLGLPMVGAIGGSVLGGLLWDSLYGTDRGSIPPADTTAALD